MEEVKHLKEETLPAGVVRLNPKIFRPGSKCKETVVNYLLTRGGIGDYICWMSALKWLATNHPQIVGRVYAPDFFIEIAENVLKPWFPRWKVYGAKSFTQKKLESRPTYGPMQRPINGTGMHLVDLGFVYFTNNTTPADGRLYCQLDLATVENVLPRHTPQNIFYAVMTPGSTYANRTLPATAFNGIKDHLLSKGIVPVFLGKKDLGDQRKILFEDGYDYSGGIDLRDKTTLLEAAKIMESARLVVGLDNGLLHLAAMTDVPIIFGYNIASPEHRRPRRRKGTILWELYPDETQLTCTFCQSKMRFMFNHDFKDCLYKDNLCLEALGQPAPWIELIEKTLKGEIPDGC